MSVFPSSAKAGDSALEALVDAAAGILAADSLPGTLGRIAHHLATLVPFDDLSLYEIEEGGDSLKPVFAVGDWVDEIMAEEIPVLSGVTGWVVRNRRTRNVPNTLHEPLCTVVTGTDEAAEAFVAVPLIAHDRVVGSLNVYRTGADVPFTDREVELVERFATMAALAYDSARQRDLLREEVRTDSLTGLLNHRGSQERLRAALDEADGRPVSVVVIDLDHFKRINDTFGHAEGDRALALAAAALRDVVRDTDAVGRLGGEEFVLVLPGVDAGAAREAAERARVAISGVQIGGRELACSAGLACHPDDAADAPGLLMAADAALYAAKDKGRGRTCRYRPSLALRPVARRGARGDRGDPARRRPLPQRRLPARARARHGPRLGLRGARPLRRRAAPRPRRVVRPGPPRRARRRARGGGAARGAGRARPPRRDVPRPQREPAGAGAAARPRRAAARTSPRSWSS